MKSRSILRPSWFTSGHGRWLLVAGLIAVAAAAPGQPAATGGMPDLNARQGCKHKTFVYVMTYQEGIDKFLIGPDGRLWPSEATQIYDRDGYPAFLVADPGGHAIWTGGRYDNDPETPGHVDRYKVTATGVLENRWGMDAGVTPNFVVFGRGGRFVYVYTDTTLLGCSTSDGRDLRIDKARSVDIGPDALITSDPLGRCVIVRRKDARKIEVYRVTDSGDLQHSADLGFAECPTSVSWLPRTAIAYVALSDSGVMCVVGVSQAGRASVIQSVHVLPPQAAGLRVFAAHPSGRFLYAGCGYRGRLLLLNIHIQQGGLIAVGKTTQQPLAQTNDMVISSDGRYAYVTGEGPCVITEYRIANDGSLTRFATRIPSDDMLSIAIASD
ncbi:MAG: beta-propeller fold lactonase family protein [Capsulimonadaceae bacterium]